mgnify:FL=1
MPPLSCRAADLNSCSHPLPPVDRRDQEPFHHFVDFHARERLLDPDLVSVNDGTLQCARFNAAFQRRFYTIERFGRRPLLVSLLDLAGAESERD